MSAFPVRGLRWVPKRANQLKKPQISFRRFAAYRQMTLSRVGACVMRASRCPMRRSAVGQVRSGANGNVRRHRPPVNAGIALCAASAPANEKVGSTSRSALRIAMLGALGRSATAWLSLRERGPPRLFDHFFFGFPVGGVMPLANPTGAGAGSFFCFGFLISRLPRICPLAMIFSCINPIRRCGR